MTAINPIASQLRTQAEKESDPLRRLELLEVAKVADKIPERQPPCDWGRLLRHPKFADCPCQELAGAALILIDDSTIFGKGGVVICLCLRHTAVCEALGLIKEV